MTGGYSIPFCGAQVWPQRSSQHSALGTTPTDPEIFPVQRYPYSKWKKKTSNGSLSNMPGTACTKIVEQSENEFSTKLELFSISSYFLTSLSISS